MHRAVFLSGRAIVAAAALLFVSIFVTGTSYAQLAGDDVTYDVKVSSGASGNANELPLNYTVEYDNGQREDISVGSEGLKQYTTAAGQNPVAIWFWNVRYPVGHDLFCIPDQSGGCWCFCLKWVQVEWFWWQVRPIYMWYYDPCCH
ncbi:MAG TPA: hypothetical protein VHI13_21540 [Candidatus Kapabacteria bacterium]|nr:hypothetical protein [Candidatus Kapabacteria bacterium]